LYLSAFFKRHRQDYYDKLNSYRFDKGVGNWLKFFLEGVRAVSAEAVETAKQITRLKEKHVKAVTSFGRNAETALKLLMSLYVTPVVDAASVAKITGISSKTNVSNLIDKFIDAEILREMTGKVRHRRFSYEDYLNLFTTEKKL